MPFIAAAVRHQGIAGAAKVCIAASIVMLIFSVLRLGRHVSKVPHAVLAGFSCGIGGMMIISQLRTMLGLRAPQGGWHESMLGQLLQVASNILRMQPIPALLGLVVIVIATVAASASQPCRRCVSHVSTNCHCPSRSPRFTKLPMVDAIDAEL